MPAVAATVLLLLSLTCGRLHVSLGQGVSVPPSSGVAPACDPACIRGTCKQAVNSVALYCDCSGTGFRGPVCNTFQGIAPSSGAPTPSPTSRCSPVCQNGGACRQEVNSAAYYCDCSRTGYKGATCSAPSIASGPSANLSATTSPCSPPCQHGGECKQEVNSAAYYCDCSRTGFRGAFCAAQANASSPAPAVQAVPSNASSCAPACQNGGHLQAGSQLGCLLLRLQPHRLQGGGLLSAGCLQSGSERRIQHIRVLPALQERDAVQAEGQCRRLLLRLPGHGFHQAGLRHRARVSAGLSHETGCQ